MDESRVRAVDFAWENSGGKGLLVWGTTAGQITYRTFTAPNTWGAITNVAMGTNAHWWVELRTNPFPRTTKILGAVLETTANALGAIKWDGSTFTVIGASTFSANSLADWEGFELEYRDAVAPSDVQYTVCKNLVVSNCDAASEFTKADGSAGFDTVATSVETASYSSLATTYEANGDLWVSYVKDVDATTRAVYARFLDYPAATWAAAETVDSFSGTIFTKPSIGIDKDNNVHTLYVATSGPQVYYNQRIGVSWGTREAVGLSSDNPTLVVRSPNDPTYGTDSAGLYWKTSTSETYFFTHIPEFETIVVPVAVCLIVIWGWRRTGGKRRSQGKPSGSEPAENVDGPRRWWVNSVPDYPL